jgi:ubiquinone/menaquinone biosynthesis C-methylase UbiE
MEISEKNHLDNDRNIALYSSLLQKHGKNFQALNWGSEKSQKLRFKILAEIGIQNGDSVLDLGCGLGDLYQWFKVIKTDVIYTGIDLTPAMVKHAQERFPEINFFEGNINGLPETQVAGYDFVVASGIFAHRQQQPTEFLYETIHEMYRRAKKGIAFNCLSSWREEQDEGEFYADPIETLNYCRSISNCITLRHDYHHGDFTLYIYNPDFVL